MPAAAGPRTTERRSSLWKSLREKMTRRRSSSNIGVADAVAAIEARRSSAEHLIATKAPRCTATAWNLIVAQCFAISRQVIRADRYGNVDKKKWFSFGSKKRKKVLWPPPIDKELDLSEEEWDELSANCPALHKCSITMEMMKEPAMATVTGISYDRPAITRWINERGIDPHDPQHKLTLAHLAPNYFARSSIVTYIKSSEIYEVRHSAFGRSGGPNGY